MPPILMTTRASPEALLLPRGLENPSHIPNPPLETAGLPDFQWLLNITAEPLLQLGS